LSPVQIFHASLTTNQHVRTSHKDF
jgi:hypothetical protein